jgi:hypothetical protein
MLTRQFRFVLFSATLATVVVVPFVLDQRRSGPQQPTSVELDVFDCGKITGVGDAALDQLLDTGQRSYVSL